VLLFDGDGRVLLLRGHDPHQPERSWWFTPGGGLDGDESHREAASRELLEETGYDVPLGALEGPVWERTALFDFLSQPYVQHEEFFVARIDATAPMVTARWTASEHDTLDDLRWFSPAQVTALSIEVFPTALGQLLATVAPWDGRLRHLGREHA
jgi:8-oxo-dGTP pyrophosphatase MutT (NUDIX family)